MLQAYDREIEDDTDLEVNADADVENDDADHAATAATTTAKLGLTMEEMQANSFILMIAGYETTSTALAFTAYELALHPEIQRKLQNEIDEYFPEVCPFRSEHEEIFNYLTEINDKIMIFSSPFPMCHILEMQT